MHTGSRHGRQRAWLWHYANADEEPDPRLPQVYDEWIDDEGLSQARPDRDTCSDEEVLGYEVLSESYVMRLTESALDCEDATYWIEVFQPDPLTCTSPPVLGMGNYVFRMNIYDCMPYIGFSETLTARERLSAPESDVVHVMIYAR